MRRILFVPLISALLFIVACGGGSSSSSNSGGSTGPTSTAGGNTIVTSGNNVAPLIVDAGPASVASSNEPDFNMAFTTLVVCAPGTSNCVTIDHVLVDTGSTGLRIPAGAFPTLTNGANVLAALQNVNTSTPVAECYEFVDSFNWGTVRYADVKLGGSSNTSEVASSVPIQVTGDPSVPSIPSDCTGAEADTVAELGANGLLGVNYLQYDCDALGFSNPCLSSSTAPSGMYYTCSGSSCSVSAAPFNQQVRNPVSMFATDNNGVIVELPGVPIGGETGISTGQGSLVFGIGTQSNNGLSSSAVVLNIDSNPNDPQYAGVTTVFKGTSYPNSAEAKTLEADGSFTIGSFLDSGSDAIYFLDQPQSGITACSDGWYCPSSTESLTAVNQATNGNSSNVQFNVSNGDTLSASYTAFSDLAAPNTSGTPDSLTQAEDGYFDWGLSFFYGRNVYTAIWGVTSPSGVPAGPLWAY